MTQAIIVAVLSLCGTLIGSIAGILTANRLANFRIEQLEKKVEKHNDLIERMAINEKEDQTQWKRIDELKERVDTLELLK